MSTPILREASKARLTPFPLADSATARGTILVLPGGGYHTLSLREAAPVANAYNALGYHAFVLEYSIEPAPLHTLPLADTAWAVDHIRSHAAEYGLDPDRIILCGFSAGGHLAASLGNYWSRPEFFGGTKPAEAYRPNAMILCYPVLVAGLFTHDGTLNRLVGGGELSARIPFSMEWQANPTTPPTFMFHNVDDYSVPVENVLMMAASLSTHRVPFELHVFPKGGHGQSVATEEVLGTEVNHPIHAHVAHWVELSAEWMDLTFS